MHLYRDDDGRVVAQSKPYESPQELPFSEPAYLFRSKHEGAPDGVLDQPPSVTEVASLREEAPSFLNELQALVGRCQIEQSHVDSRSRIFDNNAFTFDAPEQKEDFTESVGKLAIANVPTLNGMGPPRCVCVRVVDGGPRCAGAPDGPRCSVCLPVAVVWT